MALIKRLLSTCVDCELGQNHTMSSDSMHAFVDSNVCRCRCHDHPCNNVTLQLRRSWSYNMSAWLHKAHSHVLWFRLSSHRWLCGLAGIRQGWRQCCCSRKWGDKQKTVCQVWCHSYVQRAGFCLDLRCLCNIAKVLCWTALPGCLNRQATTVFTSMARRSLSH